MELIHADHDGTLVLELREPRVESANAQDFKVKLLEFIDQGHERIALDLSHLLFIDSSGIAVLISGLKALQGKGEIVLCSVQERIMKIFRLTKLDRGVFRFFPDTAAALAALSR